MSLFGVGDGGGGPKYENIELGKRLSNLESVPQVKFDTARKFFHRLDKESHKLNKWKIHIRKFPNNKCLPFI